MRCSCRRRRLVGSTNTYRESLFGRASAGSEPIAGDITRLRYEAAVQPCVTERWGCPPAATEGRFPVPESNELQNNFPLQGLFAYLRATLHF